MNKPQQSQFWGIYDGVDRCWLGNPDGPLLYADGEIKSHPVTGQFLARFAATVMTERCRYPAGRLCARIYDEVGIRHKDRITPPLSLRRALARLNKR